MYFTDSDDSEPPQGRNGGFYQTAQIGDSTLYPIYTRGQDLGKYHHVFSEVRDHLERFHAYTKMSVHTFKYIYDKI